MSDIINKKSLETIGTVIFIFAAFLIPLCFFGYLAEKKGDMEAKEEVTYEYEYVFTNTRTGEKIVKRETCKTVEPDLFCGEEKNSVRVGNKLCDLQRNVYLIVGDNFIRQEDFTCTVEMYNITGKKGAQYD